MNKLSIMIIILSISLNMFASSKYSVTKVIDGDTIECTDGNINFRVRLAG
ncbi:MAG: hypothetical protein ABIA04_00500 [Pseudomonadota bacterium]